LDRSVENEPQAVNKRVKHLFHFLLACGYRLERESPVLLVQARESGRAATLD